MNNIKLKFIPPAEATPQFKAGVHKTGKIGLSIKTAEHFKIGTDKSIELAMNEADSNDRSIYGVLRKASDAKGYKINKAGDYHSISAKDFFDTIKFDYSRSNMNFLVSSIDVDGQEVIKFEIVK